MDAFQIKHSLTENLEMYMCGWNKKSKKYQGIVWLEVLGEVNNVIILR